MPRIPTEVSARIGTATARRGARSAPKSRMPMPTRRTVVTVAVTTPDSVMPMTNVSRRVGVSHAGSSVPASSSILIE